MEHKVIIVRPPNIPNVADFEMALVKFKGDYDPDKIRKGKRLKTNDKGYNIPYQRKFNAARNSK